MYICTKIHHHDSLVLVLLHLHGPVLLQLLDGVHQLSLCDIVLTETLAVSLVTSRSLSSAQLDLLHLGGGI